MIWWSIFFHECNDESSSNFGGGFLNGHAAQFEAVTTSYRLSSSLGWLRFSRFFSIRSARSCLRTTVAYSIRPCNAAMRREATLPRSRMEKDLWASSVWMKVSRNILLCSSWLNKRSAFSTLAGDWEERKHLIKWKKKQENKNTNGKSRQEGDERNMRNNNCCLNAYLEKAPLQWDLIVLCWLFSKHFLVRHVSRRLFHQGLAGLLISFCLRF